MSRMYFDKKSYVNKLKECFKARDDFNDLAYCRNSHGEEFLIMSDIVGQIAMLDITGYCEADILHCVAEIECGIPSKNYITDRAKRLEIARMMR